MSQPEETQGGRPRRDPAGLLHRRYLAAFAVVAALLLLNQFLVQPSLLRIAVDAPTINVAGRQRMLSQRLAKAALALERGGGGPAGRARFGELVEVRRAWESGHRRLRRGGRDVEVSEAIRLAFDELDPAFRRLRDAADLLIRAQASGEPDVEAVRRAVGTILEVEGEYLDRMERIVGLHERAARSRVDRLLWTGRAVTALILAALVVIGLFILRPASRLIRRQVVDLQRAHDGLEAKVRERTRDLEIARQRLERESAERREIEARHRAMLETFSHASRINTLGEMASGLAHELNQPLGAIANYAEGCLVALERDPPDRNELRPVLGKILASALRAGEIIRRVRRFVTRRGLETERIDPGRALVEVAELLRDEADSRRIRLQVESAPDLPCLWGDPIQIQQVLINLVRNAFAAVDAAEVTTRTVVLETFVDRPGAVTFRVRDDGEGITADRLPHIFETYFSTRADGMGMGLAISRTIVEAHQGILTVESVPGMGTTFQFRLPTDAPGNDAGTDGPHC